MIAILPHILSLLQYVTILKEKKHTRLKYCLCCGKEGLWFHGHYHRKPDREKRSDESLNPVIILRFFCRYCKKTCSQLPECIPPRRWYLWEVQQSVISLLLSGASLRTASRLLTPSRSTCRRWWHRLKEQFLLHGDTLRTHLSELGRTFTFNGFWQACFQKISLGKAMLLCHQTGVAIP